MPRRDDNVEPTFNVIINEEEQYSLWPTERELPAGWRTVGVSGTKQKCLDYIQEVWTDMRPASLRRMMEEEKQRNEARS